MIVSSSNPVTNGAGDTASFIREVVPNLDKPFLVKLVDPRPFFVPGSSRVHATLVSTVRQMTENPGNVRSLKKANERFNIGYNGNRGGLYSFCISLWGRRIDELHAMLNHAPLAPSIRVQGKWDVRAYWLADGACDAHDWRPVQDALAQYFHTGNHLRDAALFFELPGLDTLWITSGGAIIRTPVTCVVFQPKRRYTARQMLDAFKRHRCGIRGN